MKTVDEILREMREFADADSQTIGRDVLRREIQHFADRIKVAVAKSATTTPPCKESSQVGNGANMRETDGWLNQLVNLINGEIAHYMSQGADCFSVDCGSWHIQYDRAKGETDGSK